MSKLSKQEGVTEAIGLRFDRFEKGLNGQSKQPIHQLRRSAYDVLLNDGLPGPKHEEYRYTPISKQLQKHFDLVGEASHDTTGAVEVPTIEGLEANVLVFVNGIYDATRSSIMSNELIIAPLAEAYTTHQEEIDAHLGKYAKAEADGYTAFNTAFTQEGLFIKVPKGKAVETPVLIWYLNDGSGARPLVQPRNLVIAEANSQVCITEWYKTTAETVSFTNVVTEVLVHEHAVVDHYKVQQEAATAYHVSNTHFEQVAQSVVNSVTVSLSGAMVRNNLNLVLDAEHCESNMYGLYLLNDKTHVDNHTVVDHRKPNSYSNELYKGIMDDRSTGVFNGKIFVRQDAQKTNAFQSNRNILLSDDAAVNTKPQLEIWADDVKCSHGATTGRLDDEQLFYLRARGVDAITARAILLYAFAKDVLEHVKPEALRLYLDHIIGQRLEQNPD